MNAEKLLTPNELAARWGLSKATILRMFHAGILPGVTLCLGEERNTVRFRLATVEKFEQQREQQRHGNGHTVREAGAGD